MCLAKRTFLEEPLWFRCGGLNRSFMEKTLAQMFLCCGVRREHPRAGAHVGFAALPEKFVCYAFF